MKHAQTDTLILGLLQTVVILLIVASPAAAQIESDRFEAGGLIIYTFLREIGTRDAGVGTEAAGLGARLAYHVFPYMDVETEIIVLPGNSATSGNRLQGLFGVKAGARSSKVGIFVKARPGFIYFARDPFGVSKPGSSVFSHERASSIEPSMDLGGVIEYYTARGLILRLDAGSTIIRYAQRTVRISQFQPDVIAGGFTAGNVQVSFGVGFRF